MRVLKRFGSVAAIAALIVLSLIVRGAASPENPAFVRNDEPSEPLVPSRIPVRRNDVYDLKVRLTELGFYSGPIDDVYDEAAVSAVKAFQKSYWLTPDGVVEKTTWRALGHGVIRPATGDTGPLPEGVVEIEVDTATLTLTVLVDGKPCRTYPIAGGKWTDLTPVGEWKIIDKGYKVGGPFGSRWMALNVPWGNYGIHGTDRPWSIGSYASAGCVRMFNEDIEELYDLVEIGTRVKIKGYLPRLNWNRPFTYGTEGPEVVVLQEGLRQFGFDAGPCDGILGERTEAMLNEMATVFGFGKGRTVVRDLITVMGIRGS
ncbi:MAG: L,D-transpeptidase family protein [Bacillota bacterium]|nr:L,D-transpeptidase family protein [Candidatus Fermentithermobacillaceae bacterium]